MKRSGPLKRRKPLGRKPLRRGGRLRRTNFKRKPPKRRPPEGPLTPKAWYLTALREARRESRWPADGFGRPAKVGDVEVHHVIEKAELRTRRLYHLVWDPRNALVVLADQHSGHTWTGGERRIPRGQLRPENHAFARELGEWAVLRIEQRYPETNDPKEVG